MVPVILLVKPMEVLLPEQMVCELAVGVITGRGFTVMVTVFFVPTQPAGDVGVTSYTTVPATVPVAVNVCAIGVPVPALAPLTPVAL